MNKFIEIGVAHGLQLVSRTAADAHEEDVDHKGRGQEGQPGGEPHFVPTLTKWKWIVKRQKRSQTKIQLHFPAVKQATQAPRQQK